MRESCQITIFGEVLFDCFPDGSEVLGGAPFNVAWHLRGFGLSPRLISRVGTDVMGQRILGSMNRWGLDDSSVQRDPLHPTGRVNISIVDGEPRYEIVAGSAYDFIEASQIRALPSTGILYHGSLALRQAPCLEALKVLKAVHRGTIFLDVNLRSPWWSKESLLPLLDAADHVKLNEAELALLATNGSAGSADPDDAGLSSCMQAFSCRHGLKTLIVTRGARGAVLLSEEQTLAVAPPPVTDVVDTVGAGDGFAAALLYGLSRDWPLRDCLERAGAFASALVARRGATIDDVSVYQGFLREWGVS